MKPDPGTDEAIQLGCMCPPHSRQPALPTKAAIQKFGFLNDIQFLVTPTCPVHGWRQ